MDQAHEAIFEATGTSLDEKQDNKGYEFMWFVDTAAGLAILLNAVHIGAQANCATHSDGPCLSAEGMAAVDASFTVLFAMELLIRRRQVPSWRSFFWTHEDASWHCFDTVVVGLSIASLYLQQNAEDDGQGGFFSMFRLLRVTRLARVVRFFRVFKQLTVMLLSLIDGMKTLVWAACLLLLILFIVACLLIFVNEDLISSLHDTPFAVLFESLPVLLSSHSLGSSSHCQCCYRADLRLASHQASFNRICKLSYIFLIF
jgi:hypothetical protein